MRLLKQLNTFTKVTLGIGILLMVYGFLSRSIPIYFFWESSSIGLWFLYVGIISLLSTEIKRLKTINKKGTLNKIIIGIIGLILLVKTILIIVILNTDAYEVSKVYLKNNQKIKTEVGNIEDFGLIPTGSITVQSDVHGEIGEANIELIIKGNKAFKEVSVFLFKDYGKDWDVIKIE